MSSTDARFDVATIRTGWQLLGSDGEMVGTIEGVGANYFLVRQGVLAVAGARGGDRRSSATR